jgi:hypothetical protein
MTPSTRSFGALIAHDGVCLVEYRAERTGLRIVEEWMDGGRSSSIDEALDRLLALLASRQFSRAHIALAIEQFGVIHHGMTLPDADDRILRPIIERELQREFGVADSVVMFSRAPVAQRPGQTRDKTAAPSGPRHVFIAAAPRAAIDAVRAKLEGHRITVDVVTVVPKAIHSLYEATGGALEPTAVLACLEGGPHLIFFLDGRLELAVDPPIALEGERASVARILDQVERGAVYFRQQFRGAVATRLLLAARPTEYDELAATLEERLNVRVKPLFAGASSPEAVVAMGAVLEAQYEAPLDLYPHPPTFTERVAGKLRGPNAAMAAAGAVAVIAGLWAALQFASLSSVRRENAKLQSQARSSLTSVAPMREIAERRADFATEVAFTRGARSERVELTASLQAIAEELPPGIRFDSLRVSRTPTGWMASIGGQSSGPTAAQAVRSLDSFYQIVRTRRGVTGPILDQLDYPASASADSVRKAGDPIVIQFHVSFAMARTPADGGAR